MKKTKSGRKMPQRSRNAGSAGPGKSFFAADGIIIRISVIIINGSGTEISGIRTKILKGLFA